MDAKLKKVCKNCTASSLKTYNSSIRRLYKIFLDDPKKAKKIKKLDDLPDGSRWLMSDKLETAYKALPVNKRRHLSSSACTVPVCEQTFPTAVVDCLCCCHRRTDEEGHEEERPVQKNEMPSEEGPTYYYLSQNGRPTEIPGTQAFTHK